MYLNTDNSPLGFYFQLKVDNEIFSFKEVSGISSEISIDEITEGGENRFKYRVPNAMKYLNLELKRGLVPKNSKLVRWINNTMQQGLSSEIKLKNVEVSLVNEKEETIRTWNFIKAWPVAWDFGALNAVNNDVLIESLRISYTHYTIQKPAE